MPRLLSLAVLLMLPLTAAEMTNLEIVVHNQAGKPVSQAGVIVKFVQGRSKMKLGAKDRKEWETKTGEEGTVKIPPIPQGKILIQVIAKGYQTFGQTFDIDEEEKTVEINLNPPQQQYTAH